MTIDRGTHAGSVGDGKVRPGVRRVARSEIASPKATAPIKAGGAGADVYNFTGSYGGDWVVDSDGQGSIKVDGLTLAGGKKLTPGYYKDSATGWTYALSSGALVLRKDGSLNQITVRGWQPGQLGITLDDTAVVPVTTTSYSGDFKNRVTDTYYAYFNNNYVQDGNLLEANAQDIITGSSLADKIQGLAGNDALFGAAGDDVIEGGDGDDLLLGGMGQDTLNGGAGRDFIYGSAAGGLDHPLRTTDAPPVAPGPEYTRGLGWVTYDRGTDANGRKTYGLVGGGGLSTLSGDATSLIDGGAGDDWIRAGSGSDVVHGGDDKDDIMGLAGNDVLFGDAGDDRIIGRASNDSIWRMAA